MNTFDALSHVADLLLNDPAISPIKIKNELTRIGAPASVIRDADIRSRVMPLVKARADVLEQKANIPRSVDNYNNFDHLYSDATGKIVPAPKAEGFDLKVPVNKSITGGNNPIEGLDMTRGTAFNRKPPMDYPLATQEQASMFKTGARNAGERTDILKRIQEEAANADYLKNLEAQSQRTAAQSSLDNITRDNAVNFDDLAGRFTKPQPRVVKASEILGKNVPVDQQLVPYQDQDKVFQQNLDAAGRRAKAAEDLAGKSKRYKTGSAKGGDNVADSIFNDINGAKTAAQTENKAASGLSSATNATNSAAEKIVESGAKGGLEKGAGGIFFKKGNAALEVLANKFPVASKVLRSKWLGPAVVGGFALHDYMTGEKDLPHILGGDVVGGLAGAEAGGLAGAGLGSMIAPGPGTVIGGLGGAIIGGMGGTKLGNGLVDAFMNKSGGASAEESQPSIDPDLLKQAEALARAEIEARKPKEGAGGTVRKREGVSLPASPSIGGGSLDAAYKIIQSMDAQASRNNNR